jgi:hypothetical protein
MARMPEVFIDVVRAESVRLKAGDLLVLKLPERLWTRGPEPPINPLLDGVREAIHEILGFEVPVICIPADADITSIDVEDFVSAFTGTVQ